MMTGAEKEMDKESLRSNNNNNSKEKSGGDGASLLLRGSSDTIRHTATTTTSSDLVLQWGNRKRLRCMKIQVKDDSSAPVQRTTVRVDRRVVKDPPNQPLPTPPIPHTTTTTLNHSNRYPNLRQRSSSPQQPPSRILRYSYAFFLIYFYFCELHIIILILIFIPSKIGGEW